MATVTIALNVLKGLLPLIEAQAKDEVMLLWDFKDDLKEMETTLAMLEAVLNDAARQSEEDKAVSIWLAELRSACYDIQDMLDSYLQQYKKLQSGNKVKVFLYKLYSRFDLAHKMKNTRKRLKNIEEKKNMFNLKVNVGLDMSGLIKERETSSESIELLVLGRDKEQSEIVDLILQNKNNDELFVIPIYGMGGLGKTTLAKLIFNDRRLRDSKHFDVRAWAYVSLKFDLHNIGRRIITSVKGSECNLQILEQISKELKDEMSGKRCLIVLDDVWTVNMDHWERFKIMLKDSLKGSTVVVTTRQENIAKDVASHAPYCLEALSKETCLQLFQNRAFNSTDEMRRYPKLVEIGKEIVNKCGGVPLTANALGSTLSSKREEVFWLYVKNSEIWELHDNDLIASSSTMTTENNVSLSQNRILSSLKLSYYLLPPQLKPCFAYCSIFPKGHKIDTTKLVQHWISLNFIRSTHENSPTIEYIAKGYLNGLISMSFLQRCEDLYLKHTVVMHDLMHELARLVAKDHDIQIISDTENIRNTNITPYRYISLYGPSKEILKLDEFVRLDGKVRSIYLNSSNDELVMLNDNSFSQLTSLRVLDVQDCFTNLPNSLKELKELHYLSAPSCSQLNNELIEYLGNLQSLQYLNLSRCSELEKLPECLGNLKSLQYLNLSCCYKLKEVPECLGNLQSLQYINLSLCSNFKKLPESLGNLRSLQYLNLSLCSNLEKLPECLGILQGLQFLNLSGCVQLVALPESISGLVKLLHLNVSDCNKLDSISCISSLTNLQRLVIDSLYQVDSLLGLLVHLTNLRHLSTTYRDPPLKLSSLAEIRSFTNFETLELNLDFIVKEENVEEEGISRQCCNIVGLQHLNMLDGELTLRGLEKVKNPKDAERANLKGKLKLTGLKLYWDEDNQLDNGVDTAVLRSLQPASSKLIELIISGYKGRQWPSWVSNIPNSSLLLSSIVLLPNLKYMSLYNIPSLNKIDGGLFEEKIHEAVLFPSLEQFHISNMVNLEHVLLSEDEQVMSSFPCLKWLSIKNCPCFSHLSLNPSIKNLTLEGNVYILFSTGSIARTSTISLETLEIKNCSNLVSLPEWLGEFSASLKKLSIEGCPLLASLPNKLTQLTNLKELSIIGCSVAFKEKYLNGQDKINILYIPNVWINYQRVITQQLPTAQPQPQVLITQEPREIHEGHDVHDKIDIDAHLPSSNDQDQLRVVDGGDSFTVISAIHEVTSFFKKSFTDVWHNWTSVSKEKKTQCCEELQEQDTRKRPPSSDLYKVTPKKRKEDK